MPIANALVFDPSPPGPGTSSGTYGLQFNPNTGTATLSLPAGGALATTTVSTPSAAAHSGSNVTSVSVAAGSNDMRGVINFTTPGTLVAGAQVDVTFGAAKSAAPAAIIITPQTQAAGTTVSNFTVSAVTTTGFSINAPTAGMTISTAYAIGYIVAS